MFRLAGTATCQYGLDDWGFDTWQGLGIFLFTTASRTALGSTQPPIQWVPWALSLRVKLPGCEAYQSPPSKAEVKIRGDVSPFPKTPSWRGAQLKPRDNFTFTFSIIAKEGPMVW
jgi:hypothetical protein